MRLREALGPEVQVPTNKKSLIVTVIHRGGAYDYGKVSTDEDDGKKI